MAAFANSTLVSISSPDEDTSATSVTNSSRGVPVPEGCVTNDFFQVIPWDNEHNLLPKEVDNIVSLVFTGLCMPVLFVVAVLTNLINMVVFYKHGLKERINACLFTLALVDLLSISAAFTFGSDVLYMYVIGRGDEIGPAAQFIVRNYLTGLHGLLTSSQMVYSFIAVERCLCITKPLLVKMFMSTRTTMLWLWSMVLVIMGTSMFVIGVLYGIVCVFHPADNTVSYMVYPTQFYFRIKFVVDFMYSALLGLLFSGASFTVVFVCTVITARKLRQLSKWRKKVSSASASVSSRDVALARMIIGTSIMFTICMMPPLFLNTSLIFVPDLGLAGRYDNLAWVIRRCYQLATAVNNTFNFFVYYAYGSRFRETVHGLFAACPCLGASAKQ